MNHTRQSTKRGGFSLLELLIVIGIIVFLISISGVFYANFLDRTRETATAGKIKKIHEQLKQRIDAFNRHFTEQKRNGSLNGAVDQKVRELQQVYSAPGVSREAAEILVRKDRFRLAFPQSFNPDETPDANANGTPDIVERIEAATGVSYNATNHQRQTESAALLYFILTGSSVFGIPPVDSDELEALDTDKDGLLEVVDAWSHPLRFYRWPTRLIKPGSAPSYASAGGINREVAGLLIQGLPAATGAARDPLNEDPDDSFGFLTSEGRRLPAFGTYLTEGRYHTLDTYHVPLIVSPGADEALGLFEPFDTTSFGRLAQPDMNNIDPLTDNITNLNQRAGGN